MACRPVPSCAALGCLAIVAYRLPCLAQPNRGSAALTRCRPQGHLRSQGVLQCHTMAEGLDWLPEDGVVLTRDDHERIFMNLRALIAGTGQVDPNRSFAVDIAIAITHAIERERGVE